MSGCKATHTFLASKESVPPPLGMVADLGLIYAQLKTQNLTPGYVDGLTLLIIDLDINWRCVIIFYNELTTPLPFPHQLHSVDLCTHFQLNTIFKGNMETCRYNLFPFSAGTSLIFSSAPLLVYCAVPCISFESNRLS